MEGRTVNCARTLIVVAAVAGAVNAQQESADEQVAVLCAYRAATAPVIDAALNDACWAQASVATPFLLAGSPGLPREQTVACVCWDDRCLYIAVEAFEKYLDPRVQMTHLVRAEQKRSDGSVFADECVEFFLQPTTGAYYHFAANSIGTLYDAQRVDRAWNSGWRAAARRGEESYVVEAAIPLAALGAEITAGSEWRANFCRERTAVRELSTWSGLQGGFHAPEAFGWLRFAERGIAVRSVEITAPTPRSRSAEAQIDASAGRDGNVRLLLHAVGAQDGARRQMAEASFGGDGTATARTGLAFPRTWQAGPVRVWCSVLEGSELRYSSAPFSVALSGAYVRLNVAAHETRHTVYLNGQARNAHGELELALQEGLNVLAVVADATGADAWVRPELALGHHALPASRGWLATTEPPDEWMTAASADGFAPAAARGEGIWAPDREARHVCLRRAIYVSPSQPRFFPKMDTVYVSRGSAQLLKPYLPSAPELASAGYRLILELPSPMELVATDGVTGNSPRDIQPLPDRDRDGRPYHRYAAEYGLYPGTGLELNMRWGDETGATLTYQPAIVAGGTFDWRHFSRELDVPAGAISAHPLIIKWQKRGITGTFWIDNLAFHKQGETDNLLKMGTFDEPEWGQRGLLVAEGPDGSRCCKIVVTAESVDRQQALWVDKDDVVPVDPNATYVVEFDAKAEDLGSPGGRPKLAALVRAPAEMPEGEHTIHTYFETQDGHVTEAPRETRLVVLPPLKDVRPKRARITPCYYSSRFDSPEVQQAYADDARRAGITWTYGKPSNVVAQRLLPEGHRVILSLGYEPWHVPPTDRELLERKPDVAARDFKGKPLKYTVCPTWALGEGGEYRAALAQFVEQSVRAAGCPAVNWDLEQPVVDPPTFCTCERCLAELRKAADIAPDVELNGDVILERCREAFTRLRCRQNAELASHIRAAIKRVDATIEFSLYSGFECLRTKEHYGVDWAMMRPHLDLGIAGYGGNRELIHDTRDALGDVPFMGGEMFYLSDADDSQPAPDPRRWRNRLLRQFVESGCRGVLIWWLPVMEGGAFYATSEAAEIIAEFEGFFEQAGRCDEQVQVRGLPSDHWCALEHEGRRMVLLFSFADRESAITVEVGGPRPNAPVRQRGKDTPVGRVGEPIELKLPPFGTAVLIAQ